MPTSWCRPGFCSASCSSPSGSPSSAYAGALYLFGFIHFPHDSKTERIGVARYLFRSAFALVFTIYLIPGMWGAPLKVISGFPPPMFYSESPHGSCTASAPTASSTNVTDKVPARWWATPTTVRTALPCFP
jgi:hypothetical protein